MANEFKELKGGGFVFSKKKQTLRNIKKTNRVIEKNIKSLETNINKTRKNLTSLDNKITKETLPIGMVEKFNSIKSSLDKLQDALKKYKAQDATTQFEKINFY